MVGNILIVEYGGGIESRLFRRHWRGGKGRMKGGREGSKVGKGEG